VTAVDEVRTNAQEVAASGSTSGPADDVPRPLSRRSRDDRLTTIGALAGSFALVWLIYFYILPLSGIVGFVICWYFGFLAMYAGLVGLSNPRTVVIDRLMAAIISGAALLVGATLIVVVVYTIVRGWAALPHMNFYTQDNREGPLAPYTQGGIRNVIVGSLIQVGLAVVISLPLGLGTAVFMTEVGGWFARFVRTVVEAMTALPDLLAGLFVWVTLVTIFHFQPNGFCVAVALSVTMTPIVARSAEVALRVVPGGLREASLALGASQWNTVRRVVLPTARPGLATALILAVARGIGEAAPLLILLQVTSFYNGNPFDRRPMYSLPLYIYESIRSGQPREITRGFAAAVVLLSMVFLLFIVTRLVARTKSTSR
jgi:phosphate transport system permease protein